MTRARGPQHIQKKPQRTRSAYYAYIGLEQGDVKREIARLLCAVDRVDGEGRTVGLTYAEVHRRLHEKFPGVETSINALRWYQAKIKADDPKYFPDLGIGDLPRIRARSPRSAGGA